MNINKKPLFNENGDIEVSKKRMINGNTTNLKIGRASCRERV